MSRTSHETESLIVSDRNSGMQIKDIADLRQVSPSTVDRVLRRFGQPQKRMGRVPERSLDEEFFRLIDREDKAYWLGFIAADGCVSYNGGNAPTNFQMALAIKDAGHLEKFCKSIKYDGAIGTRLKKATQRKCVGVSIGRKEFVSHLVAQGIHPRKTWDFRPPIAGVPAHLVRHFWRGFFDGDGSLSKGFGGRSNSPIWGLSVVGTKDMMEGFAEFVRNNLPISLKCYKRRNIWEVKTGGIETPKAIAELMYSGSEMHLDRKKALAEELASFAGRRRRFLKSGGKVSRISQLACEAGIKPATLRDRMRAGMSPDEAMSAPNRRKRLLTLNGETMTVAQWSRRLGVNSTTISERLSKGESHEAALRPVRAKLTRNTGV